VRTDFFVSSVYKNINNILNLCLVCRSNALEENEFHNVLIIRRSVAGRCV
jgi:hypothetical protein